MSADPALLWEPSRERLERAHVTRYRSWLRDDRGIELADYWQLWQWSVSDLDGFWRSVWEYFAIDGGAAPATVLERRKLPGAGWCPGAELSYPARIFRNRDDDGVAIVRVSETAGPEPITWAQLRVRVARAAAALRAHGIEKGDRVVSILPNVPEAVIAFLATASIGAIWSSAGPDSGPRLLIDRFSQLTPRLLFAPRGYRHGGKHFDCEPTIAALSSALPTLETVVTLDDEDASWEAFLQTGEHAGLSFERVPFDHPLWIVFSSGSTGPPKGLVHTHGGVLLTLLMKLHLHVDLSPGDRVLWPTTTSWVMWNYLVSMLLTGATLVMYDGSPKYPDYNVLWDVAEAVDATYFGASPGFFDACMKAGVEPRRSRALASLRAVGSTGAPLMSDAFDWLYGQLGPDLWLFSSYGSTELLLPAAGASPVLPVYRGEIQGRTLGVKLEALDPDGRPLVDRVGEGAITEPVPSLPQSIWGDASGARYRDSYLARTGAWKMSDLLMITRRGTVIVSGRSDATINRGGVRIGTSEIYQAVLQLQAVEDCLMVDVTTPDGRALTPLFVVLPRRALDARLERQIKDRIRRDCSPRHVPTHIVPVAQVPRTATGKLLELPVKRMLEGSAGDRAIVAAALVDRTTIDTFLDVVYERKAS